MSSVSHADVFGCIAKLYGSDRHEMVAVDGSMKNINPFNRTAETIIEEIVWTCNDIQRALEDKGQTVEDDDD